MGNSLNKEVGLDYLKKFEQGDYKPDDLVIMSDVFNYPVKLCRNKLNKIVACVQRTQQNQHFSSHQQTELNQRIESQNESLIKLVGYYSKGESTQEYCGSIFKQCLYFYYPVGRLRDEIDIRAYLNQPFSELEIWGILRSVVNGLQCLFQQGKKCKNISPSAIYISDEGFYQICELYFVKDSSLMDEVVLHSFSSDSYLSPQQIENVRDAGFHDSSNAFQSDIFSLGVTAIDAMFLLDQRDLFKYIGKSEEIGINLLEMKDRLTLLEKSYSKTLINLISRMVEKEESKRIKLEPLFMELNRNYIRVFQHQNNDKQASKSISQFKSDHLTYLIKRKDYEKLIRRHRQSSTQGGNQLSNSLKKTIKEYEQKFTSRLVFGDEEDLSNEKQALKQQIQLVQEENKLKGKQTIDVISIMSMKDDVDSPSSSIAGTPNSMKGSENVGKKLIKKIQNQIPKLFLTQYFMKLGKLKKEREELLKKKQDLLEYEQNNSEMINWIQYLDSQLEENEQKEQQLFNSQSKDEQKEIKQSKMQPIFEEDQQESSKRQLIEHNVSAIDQLDVITEQERKQQTDENNNFYEKYNIYQRNQKYKLSNSSNGSNQASYEENFKLQSYQAPCYQYLNGDELGKSNCFRKSYLNKYNERVNKYNICTDRYSAISELFETNSTQYSQLNNTVAKNMSASYALSPLNANKTTSNDNIQYLKQLHLSTQFEPLPLTCNKSKLISPI